MTYGFIGTGNMGGALARAAAKAVEVRSSIVLGQPDAGKGRPSGG